MGRKGMKRGEKSRRGVVTDLGAGRYPAFLRLHLPLLLCVGRSLGVMHLLLLLQQQGLRQLGEGLQEADGGGGGRRGAGLLPGQGEGAGVAQGVGGLPLCQLAQHQRRLRLHLKLTWTNTQDS